MLYNAPCKNNFDAAIAMTGLNVVFDREKLVLGWQEADCKYHISRQRIGITYKKITFFLVLDQIQCILYYH